MTIRANDRWTRAGCAFWVGHRPYSPPGRCQNRRNIRPIAFKGKFELACSPHRAMIENGRKLTLARVEERERELCPRTLE